jgi:hypothetical protein
VVAGGSPQLQTDIDLAPPVPSDQRRYFRLDHFMWN